MLPGQFKIGAAQWQVVISDDLGGDDGSCDVNQNKILVSADICPAQQRRAFIHEVLHALVDFQRPMPDKKYTEEEWIRRIEGPLDAALVENGMWPWGEDG